MEADRGRLEVGKASWHWRWYSFWRTDKMDHRSQVDLCHYVRVLLIWAPLRFFFHREILPFLPLASIVAISGAIAGVVWAIVGPWHDTTLTVLTITGLVVLGLLALAGLIALLVIHIRAHPKAWSRAMARLGRAIARPFRLAGRGLRWAGYNTFGRLWIFLWTERLFWKVVVSPGAALVIVALCSGYGYLAATWTGITLMWTGFAIGVVVVLLVAIIGISEIVERVGDRRARKRAEEADQPVVIEEKGMSFVRVLWQFLVAKKHRICPLIEVRGGTS